MLTKQDDLLLRMAVLLAHFGDMAEVLPSSTPGIIEGSLYALRRRAALAGYGYVSTGITFEHLEQAGKLAAEARTLFEARGLV